MQLFVETTRGKRRFSSSSHLLLVTGATAGAIASSDQTRKPQLLGRWSTAEAEQGARRLAPFLLVAAAHAPTRSTAVNRWPSVRLPKLRSSCRATIQICCDRRPCENQIQILIWSHRWIKHVSVGANAFCTGGQRPLRGLSAHFTRVARVGLIYCGARVWPMGSGNHFWVAEVANGPSSAVEPNFLWSRDDYHCGARLGIPDYYLSSMMQLCILCGSNVILTLQVLFPLFKVLLVNLILNVHCIEI